MATERLNFTISAGRIKEDKWTKKERLKNLRGKGRTEMRGGKEQKCDERWSAKRQRPC